MVSVFHLLLQILFHHGICISHVTIHLISPWYLCFACYYNSYFTMVFVFYLLLQILFRLSYLSFTCYYKSYFAYVFCVSPVTTNLISPMVSVFHLLLHILFLLCYLCFSCYYARYRLKHCLGGRETPNRPNCYYKSYFTHGICVSPVTTNIISPMLSVLYL